MFVTFVDDFPRVPRRQVDLAHPAPDTGEVAIGDVERTVPLGVTTATGLTVPVEYVVDLHGVTFRTTQGQRLLGLVEAYTADEHWQREKGQG